MYIRNLCVYIFIYDMSHSKPGTRCRKCGKMVHISIEEHHKTFHQMECTVLFEGEQDRVRCRRNEDGSWRCPRCSAAFFGSSRKIQVSVAAVQFMYIREW